MKNIQYILRFEALILFVSTIWIYRTIGASWWMFLVLLLVPDVFMIGYLKNAKLGAFMYNVGHTYITPIFLISIFLLFHLPVLIISIIWIAHISMDRMLGYGLKLNTHFKDTHLGRIGGD